MVDLKRLEEVSLLKGLDQERLALIQPLIVLREFGEDELLFSEGEKAERLWFLLEGRVELRFELPLRKTSPAATVTAVRPGQSIGFSSLVPPHRYALSGYCVGDRCVLAEIEGAALREVMDRHPAIGYAIMSNLARLISKRFRAMQEEVVKREGYGLLMD